jgi:hypothetical protein
MSDDRLFAPPPARRSGTAGAPVALPCGQLALALVGALCGPAALRSARPSRAATTVDLRFEHPSVGRLELAVPAGDERAHSAVRQLRADPGGYARVLAVLARALELDGQPGRFRFESVHQLTHGPRPREINRSRLNEPIDELLYLLSVAAAAWTAPASGAKRRGESSAVRMGPLLRVEVINRKARTVTIAEAARPLLSRYSLQVQPAAFLIARPRARRRGPAAPLMARMRLAALIAARWRNDRQRIALGDVLVRFAWIALDASGPVEGAGAAEAAGRALRPRLREAVRALGDELGDPARYGAGLLEPVQPSSRAAHRSMLRLGLATIGDALTAPPAHQTADGVQPTLDHAQLRDAATPGPFAHLQPGTDFNASERDDSVADAEPPDSIAHDQDAPPDSIAHNQQHHQPERSDWRAHDQDEHGPHQADGSVAMGDRRARDQDAAGCREATVGLMQLVDGRVRLELGGGVELLLPAAVAAAAGLATPRDSIAHDHDDHHPESSTLDRSRAAIGVAATTIAPQFDPPAPEPLTPNTAPDPASQQGIRAPESSSDDSDRARGARLSAALAPPTAHAPPAASPGAPSRAGPDDIDRRRSA